MSAFETFILGHEAAFRLSVFAAILLLFVGLESLFPRRRRDWGRWKRWPGNLLIAALNSLVLRVALPVLAVGLAIQAGEEGWGLFNLLAWPRWLEFVAAVVLFDLLIYGQHVMFHFVPPLWRVHRMHHADLDIDATTGVRFHPIEIVISMIIKLGGVMVLGAPAAAVVMFEVILNATAMFNHSNLRMPAALDRVLRAVIVTPDMHRVHHSVLRAEHNRNFGFNLSVWDRLFGTYRAQPAAGHDGMTIGLDIYRDGRYLAPQWLLALPFVPGRPGEPEKEAPS